MIEDVILKNEKKIVFLVLDGVGDIPDKRFSGKTPLEAAKKPNIDSLSIECGVIGRIIPVEVGITPGSGPGHLGLFGYDPHKYTIGRGVLEALGLDMELEDGDLAVRANFCTKRDNVVIDRRAGRIRSEETERICKNISENIKEVRGVKVILKPGKSHRFVVVFRGKGLSDKLTDGDPHKDGLPYVYPQAKEEEAVYTASIVREFLSEAQKLISSEEVANGILLRGFSMKPALPSFKDRYGMEACAIASFPMYRGISRILGMNVAKSPLSYEDIIEIMKSCFHDYHFFFLHIKETDIAGEDGNFEEKINVIEKIDKLIPEIWGLGPDVLVITGDHSTPCLMRSHSWHPVPVLIVNRLGETDGLPFHEKNCIKGSVGTIYSKQLINLALALSSKLDKFGA